MGNTNDNNGGDDGDDETVGSTISPCNPKCNLNMIT